MDSRTSFRPIDNLSGNGMETAINIFLGVAESLIAALIYDADKSRRYARPAEDNFSLGHLGQGGAYDNRRRNRERIMTFFRFVFTFYALYAAVHMPIMLKTSHPGGVVFLDQARFIGGYLPHWGVTSDFIQAPSAAIAGLLYFPLLYIGLAASIPVTGIIDKFTEVTRGTAIAVTIIIFALLCIMVATAVVYLFYDVTPQEALISIGAVLFLTAGLSSSSGRRR